MPAPWSLATKARGVVSNLKERKGIMTPEILITGELICLAVELLVFIVIWIAIFRHASRKP